MDSIQYAIQASLKHHTLVESAGSGLWSYQRSPLAPPPYGSDVLVGKDVRQRTWNSGQFQV
jgi:hypothetical protein